MPAIGSIFNANARLIQKPAPPVANTNEIFLGDDCEFFCWTDETEGESKKWLTSCLNGISEALESEMNSRYPHRSPMATQYSVYPNTNPTSDCNCSAAPLVLAHSRNCHRRNGKTTCKMKMKNDRINKLASDAIAFHWKWFDLIWCARFMIARIEIELRRNIVHSVSSSILCFIFSHLDRRHRLSRIGLINK